MFQQGREGIYRAGLVVIGNEILTGRTPDTNTPWIAEKLIERGIVLVEIRIVPDIGDQIVRAVNDLRGQVDYLFTTGGIGPTHDDITTASVARAFGVKPERHPQAWADLCRHYETEDLNAARAKMALVPQGATLIPNPVSGAPGFVIENVYVMAGVPRIMKVMLDHVLQNLKRGQSIFSNTVACNLPESAIAEDMAALQEKHSEVEIGSYPHYRGGVAGLSLVVRGTDEEKIRAATQGLVDMIARHGGASKALGLQVKISDL